MPHNSEKKFHIFFCRYSITLICFFCCIHLQVFSQIHYYPGEAPTIQATIDLSSDGDTIVLREGRYFENIVIFRKSITLSSEFILDDDSLHIYNTIIDGSQWTDSLRRSTISLIDCNDTTTVVQGLTITGGGGSQIFAGPAEHWCGGGLIIHNSSGKILDNVIEENHLRYPKRVNAGGGVLASSAAGEHIVVRNNLIRDNSVSTAMEATAGGLWVGVEKMGHIIVEKNRILENRVLCKGPHTAHGGGVTLFGMYPEGATLLFRDNLVANNLVKADPGGDNFKARGGGLEIIYYDFESDSRIRSPFLRIAGNRINNNVSSDQGGGIAFSEANYGPSKEEPICPQVFLVGNTLLGNRAEFGAGIHNFNLALIMVGNKLENDLSLKGATEVYNDDVTYADPNHGIINAYNNLVQGQWPIGSDIFTDYPYVRSYADRWKVVDDSPENIRMRWIPPAWQQWWAIGLYLLLMVIIFWVYRQYLYYRLNLKAALELERKEKDRIRHQDEVRTRFFANISHEFRTPLTLISAPVDSLLKHVQLPEKHRKNMELVCRNVQHLQEMTNQLMDLSKLESGAMQLMVEKGDLAMHVRRVVSSFISLAESRNITLHTEISEFTEDLYFDRDKVEKIINNLLSNAFKFTRDGGEVSISLVPAEKGKDTVEKYVTIKVRDSGIGMSEEKKEKVFDRFYSEGRLHKDDPAGIGIGMSLVKEIVDLYRGGIQVISEPGKGSTFEINLPAVVSMFSPEEFSVSHASGIKKPPPELSSRKIMASSQKLKEPVDQPLVEATTGTPLILLAEDNPDLRNFIVGYMEDDLRILEAENGKVALELALKDIPDLVISDLMMPKMDGMTLLKELRNDERTSHIPFIMLTARADTESKVESFEKGTDEYIEKPFQAEELLARVRGMLNRRKELLEHYRKTFIQDPASFISLHCEEDFLTRVIRCIRDELSNQEFSVSFLSEKMNMSRVQLYRKIFATTGFSPVELIRNYRIKTAAELFKETDLNVTQIMLEVGYGSPSYFAECFRRIFGCNPSEFRVTKLK